MILSALTLALVGFIAVLRLSGAVAIASGAAATAREAARSLASPALDDAAKEAASREAAGRLFVAFLKIAGVGALAFGVSAAVLWLGAATGLYDLDAALATAASWPFVLGATALATVGWLLADRFSEEHP